jgi:hypothetical protein
MMGHPLPDALLKDAISDFAAENFEIAAYQALMGAVGSLGESLGLFAVLGLLTGGSGLLAGGFISGSTATITVGGYVLVASAVAAWYAAASMMLEGVFGRVVLPLGKVRKAEANIPGRSITHPIQFPSGMPGVRAGQ